MTCINHHTRGPYCGPECDRLTKAWQRARRVPYRFAGRRGDTYYWTRPAPGGEGLEEVVSCDAAWFWGDPS